MRGKLYSPRTLWSGKDSEGAITIKAQSLKGEILVRQEEGRDTEGGELSIGFDRNKPEKNAEELKDQFDKVVNKVKEQSASDVIIEPTSPIPLDDEEDGAKLFCKMVEGVWEITITTEDVDIKAKVRSPEKADNLQENWNKIMDEVGEFFKKYAKRL